MHWYQKVYIARSRYSIPVQAAAIHLIKNTQISYNQAHGIKLNFSGLLFCALRTQTGMLWWRKQHSEQGARDDDQDCYGILLPLKKQIPSILCSFHWTIHITEEFKGRGSIPLKNTEPLKNTVSPLTKCRISTSCSGTAPTLAECWHLVFTSNPSQNACSDLGEEMWVSPSLRLTKLIWMIK